MINRDVMQSLKQFGQFHTILCTRKDSQRDSDQAVPQTNTGGLVENTKVSERKRLKELGKKAGRKFARCPALCGAQGNYNFQIPSSKQIPNYDLTKRNTFVMFVIC
jgi:hypothetical protein